MWSNLGDRLANLGESITASAEAHAKRLREEQESPKNEGTIVQLPPPPDAFNPDSPKQQHQPQQQQSNNSNLPKWTQNLTSPQLNPTQAQSAISSSLKSWTTTLASTTQTLLTETRDIWEKEQQRLQSTAPSLFSSKPYKRDVSLPLDVEALRDAEVVYITDRIVTLSHPYMASTTDGDITPSRKLAAVGQLLSKRHGGRYMVWNLSEVEYDTGVFDDQVLVYKFPGSPSPPLGLLLKLLLSIESWLKADERNVAVLHCLTGRGRTSTVLAAFLCWTGEAGFNDVNVALEYIAQCKRVEVKALTIPSQVRYVSYFANMLDGVRPSQPPLMLKRIIMSEAPKFGKRVMEEEGEGAGGSGSEALLGCAPYLQIFKAGNLIFTTAASVNYAQTKDDLPFCAEGSGPVSFLTEAIVQGDILLRCRHLTKSGQRISMFRCAFHTGYVPPKVLRLTKAQLDGACGDKRFSDDFFLDLIFEPCDEATASQHLAANTEKTGAAATGAEGKADEDDCANEAANRRSMGTVVGNSDTTFTASAYDSMLHRDSRFWDVIAERRKENMGKMAELEKQGKTEVESKEDANEPLSGPTIGRRRDFATKQSEHADDATENEGASMSTNQQNPMSAFSIGEEFGIDLDTTNKQQSSTVAPSKLAFSPPSPPPRRKEDALMDALNDLDTDLLDDDHHMTEEITFDHDEIATDSAVSTGENAGAADESSTSAAKDSTAAIQTEAPQSDASETKDNLDILGGMEDDLADLNIANDEGDAGDIDDFDDLEDDAELEDLENFLTQVSSK